LGGVPGLPTIYYGGNNNTSGLDGKGPLSESNSIDGHESRDRRHVHKRGTTQPIGSLTQVTLGSADNDTFNYDRNTRALDTV